MSFVFIVAILITMQVCIWKVEVLAGDIVDFMMFLLFILIILIICMSLSLSRHCYCHFILSGFFRSEYISIEQMYTKEI